MDEAAISARDLCFSYGSGRVVDQVSLSASISELIGVIGPNGSGKSTLIRLLSGVLTPERGEVRIGARALREMSRLEVARAVAVVPQEHRIEFPFSVAEVVLMGRSPHVGGFRFEDGADIAIARRAMERAGVLDLAGRSIHELSGGERQRVVVARALAQDTPILLLDEPAAFLDIRHEVEMYDLLHDLKREGKTIVSVLHDLNLAALYCDRLLLMKNGRTVKFGSPQEVIQYSVLTSVYETEVYVDVNDVTGAVNVLPLSRPYRDRLRRGGSAGGTDAGA